MSYVISEEEMRVLESVRYQLGFAAALAAEVPDRASLGCNAAEMYFFTDAQKDAVKGVLDAVYERQASQRSAKPMTYVHWMHALRIASGDVMHSPNGIEGDITQRLACAAVADPDMRYVLDEWTKLIQGSAPQADAVEAAPARAKPRKRDKLASGVQ